MTPVGSHRPFFSSSTLVPLVSVVLLLVVGFVVADDYGTSQDEMANYGVGEDALQALKSRGQYDDYLRAGKRLAHHGSSYFMVWAAVTDSLRDLQPRWEHPDARHFTNFLTFLGGLVAVYSIAARLMSQRAALVTVLLLGTQPLLFGHAFINQKDTPFLAFFTMSVAAGMLGADMLVGSSADREPWIGSRGRLGGRRSLSISLMVLGALAIGGALLHGRVLPAGMLNVLRMAYDGLAPWPVQQIFNLTATDAYKTSLETYYNKATWLYWVIGVPMVVLLATGGGVGIAYKALPGLLPAFSLDGRRALAIALLAGILSGIAVGVRPIGAFAGVLVTVYYLLRAKRRAIGCVGLFWIATCLVAYITWPYLWEAPLERFAGSLLGSTEFAGKTVLYRGAKISSANLPWHYIPTLATIQLTEPVGVLLLVGIAVASLGWARRRTDRITLGLTIAWLLLPLAAIVITKASIYGNIRHVHFALVPIFLLAGMGIESILRQARYYAFKAAFIVLVLLPGVAGIVELHPYEYAYFNSYVGGIEGADGEFEIEHWCTSYRAAMEIVNKAAPFGAVVWSPRGAAAEYAGPDTQVVWRPGDLEEATYVLDCENTPSLTGFRQLAEVGRNGVVFAEVWKRVPD